MAIFPWASLPTYQDGLPLSYSDVNLARNNALALDAATLIGRRAFTDQISYLAASSFNPSPLFRGGFQFRTGLTTLTIVIVATIPGSTHTARVYVNNAGSPTTTQALTTGTNTINVTISGLGFQDGWVIDVDIDVQRTSGAIGAYEVRDAYVSPYSATPFSAWPGVPTFGAISAANLNQLGSALEHLRQRVWYMPYPAPVGILWRPLHAHGPSTRQLWRGSIARSNGANRLDMTIGYLNTNTPAEKMHLYINGSLVASTPTISTGNVGAYTFSVDLSGYGNETVLQLELVQEVITELATVGQVGTRWSLRWGETIIASPTYATPPATSTVRESLTFTALQSRLNAIGTILSTVKSRIDAAPDLFNRVRLFRMMPVLDDTQRAYFRPQMVTRSLRWRDVLVVKGKGVKLHWGQLRTTKTDTAIWEWETTRSQELVGGESVEVKQIHLDMLPGLMPGTFYSATGDDVRFIGENFQ